MGNSFTSMKTNGKTQTQINQKYEQLKQKKVIEASQESYFTQLPNNKKVIDIEEGCDGTTKTIIRFENQDFAVVEAWKKKK